MAENVEKKGGPGLFSRIARSVRDMKGEMKKVVWPTRKQIVNNTMIVLLFCAVAGLFIAGVDTLFSFVVNFLLKLT